MMIDRFLRGFTRLACVAGLVPCAWASEPLVTDDGELVFPEGASIPRSLTAAEASYIKDHPLESLRGSTPPPASLADVRCPGEYEPTQGILMAWENSWTSILARMATHITTTGNAEVYIMCDTASEATTARNTIQSLTNPSADMNRVFTYVTPTDTIWIRDYGPRYIYEGAPLGVRSIIDHTYNRPRAADDQQPFFWAMQRRHSLYEIPLVHGGGNYHLSGTGVSYATRLIANENPGLTESQIIAHWQNYQNLATTLTNPFPISIDSTQHIDMWMQITGASSAMVSDWPNASGSTQDVICDSTASLLTGLGWSVARVPAFRANNIHYTYTNVVMCNNLVLLPSYTNATVSPSNATSLAAWQAHLPGKTIAQVNCEAIVSAAGVMHCIVMHMPANLGGPSPTAYLRTLRGPQTLTPSDQADIRWSSDDDVLVSNVDILLSTDGGATFPQVIASATADDGSFLWTIPDIYAPSARIRIVARDGQGNTGSDESRADLFINGTRPPCPGDADGNRIVDFGDFTAILASFGVSGPPYSSGDADGSGNVDFGDITAALANYGLACP